MLNIKLDICYNGKNYFGWQRQSSRKTVQGTIENNLFDILANNSIKLIGASRTDSGAHALHQTANFKIDKINLELEVLKNKLNKCLPDDIYINSCQYVPEEFHSRFDAKKREYHYFISLKKNDILFKKDYTFYYPYKIEFNLLKKSLRYFIGKHNFFVFTNISKIGTKNFDRIIYRFDFKKSKDMVKFIIVGNGFLKGMIRNIIGSVLRINRLKQNPKIIEEIFKFKRREASSETVPASGLFLYRVYY